MIPSPRAIPYAPKTFTAFRITNGRTHPMPFAGDPETVDQAKDLALIGPKLICHKDHLLIRETDEDGATTLHLFAIKQRSKPDYVRDGFTTRAVKRLYAELVTVFDGETVCG
jgi:hypothetical protein